MLCEKTLVWLYSELFRQKIIGIFSNPRLTFVWVLSHPNPKKSNQFWILAILVFHQSGHQHFHIPEDSHFVVFIPILVRDAGTKPPQIPVMKRVWRGSMGSGRDTSCWDVGENILEQPFPCCLVLRIASGGENTSLGTGEGIPLVLQWFSLFLHRWK